MSKLGSLLVLIGLGSCVLSLVQYELRYLMWIENWGVGIGWAIRGGLVAFGLLLVCAGRKGGKDQK